MIRRVALITGVSLGLLYGIVLFATYQAGIPVMASFLNIYTWFPLIIVPVGAVAWWLRRNLVPVPDLKELLQYAFLAYVVYEVLYAMCTYGLFGLYDRTANDQLIRHLLAQTEAKMAGQQVPKEKLDEIRKLAGSEKGPLTIRKVLLGFGTNLVLDFIKSLFIATITKQTVHPKR
ncbi:DUF4199 domain-containing protein [Flavihumibacter petaseus]|uniref:DUF4199 domain-containing protein n=1 Tax=Flavihumibacter petaseus NBRC 106054 TaxID=1220578 RepID=A0A0E9N681_9BACT|nr:DUF4199 domain-containing protein [Flavihumibacter petaseus]GAO45313.1 hypothetical protein FPE01S_05_00100 [Flavihumibacter petaseus NBRC 106054]